MDLSQIRKEIDDIDSQLLPLFLRRMRCAEQVAQVEGSYTGQYLKPLLEKP